MGIRGKTLVRAILDGAQQIALPAFVSTLCICIVFVPVLMLSGAAKYLFTPLAMAVVFAMMTSYLLTRTIVPTLVHYLLPAEMALYQEGGKRQAAPIGGHHLAYPSVIRAALRKNASRIPRVADVGACTSLRKRRSIRSICSALPRLSRTYRSGFLSVCRRRTDAAARPVSHWHSNRRGGAHLRGSGSRDSPRHSRGRIGFDSRQIGLPSSGINLAFSDSATVGNGDGEILISLNARHRPTPEYTRELRTRLAAALPRPDLFFQPADITSQILNFGLPSPIDVQITGNDAVKNYQIAETLRYHDCGAAGRRGCVHPPARGLSNGQGQCGPCPRQ